jgi:hypothetical protein
LGILRLGFNGLDASDRDNLINIRQWPVFGMYQPDAISAFHSSLLHAAQPVPFGIELPIKY